MTNQPQRLWAAPVAVPLHEVPARTTPSRYADFRRDVLLRLSQTDPKEAIMYRFISKAQCDAHATDISDYIREAVGKGAICLRRNGESLYIWRGKNWK